MNGQARNHNRQTAFHLLVRPGEDDETIGEWARIPSRGANKTGSPYIVENLMQHPGLVSKIYDHRGFTPFHYSIVRRGCTGWCRAMLKKLPALAEQEVKKILS